MRAGRLRHRVEIQRFVSGGTDPVTGRPTDPTWVNFFDDGRLVPAEVLEGPGREPFMAGTIQAETTARINLRYFPIDKHQLMKCRILWDGYVYDIQSAERDATGLREWRLRCKDGVNDG